jgi:hypothetical protein
VVLRKIQNLLFQKKEVNALLYKKKVEETYITRQKRNFTEFESKLGTERGTDL